jgi:hypothetical protein
MSVLAIATTPKPPRVFENSISYETRNEYFLIKIKTRINPNNYRLFGLIDWNSQFELSFENHEGSQIFKKDESGEFITELYGFNENEKREVFMINESGERISEFQKVKNGGLKLLEKIVMNEDDFGTFTENGYFIIKIKNELIRYENPKLKSIYLAGNNGEYIHERYAE